MNEIKELKECIKEVLFNTIAGGNGGYQSNFGPILFQKMIKLTDYDTGLRKIFKHSTRKSRARQEQIMNFIENHKVKCYQALRHRYKFNDFKTEAGKILIQAARKDLGYSPKTYDGDIYRVLNNAYLKYLQNPENDSY